MILENGPGKAVEIGLGGQGTRDRGQGGVHYYCPGSTEWEVQTVAAVWKGREDMKDAEDMEKWAAGIQQDSQLPPLKEWVHVGIIH